MVLKNDVVSWPSYRDYCPLKAVTRFDSYVTAHTICESVDSVHASFPRLICCKHTTTAAYVGKTPTRTLSGLTEFVTMPPGLFAAPLQLQRFINGIPLQHFERFIGCVTEG